MVSLKMQMDDTPVEIETPNKLHSNTNGLNIGNFNLDKLDDVIPEKKRKKKTKQQTITKGSLDRFWTVE